jgi:hypothetical protein
MELFSFWLLAGENLRSFGDERRRSLALGAAEIWIFTPLWGPNGQNSGGNRGGGPFVFTP